MAQGMARGMPLALLMHQTNHTLMLLHINIMPIEHTLGG